MTSGLRLQGQVFCGLALVLVIASLAGARLAPPHELLAAGVLITVLGMPHGSFDVVFARRLFGVAGFEGWTLFSLLYVGLAAAVVALWWVAPTLFLGAFLVLSAVHFGGDLAAGVPTLTRCLYGGAVIVLPGLWHGPELQQLLGLLAGPASADWVAAALGPLAAPWLAATAFCCMRLARTSWPAALEPAALAALAVTAPPLVTFTAYFCAMHSPRHILRTLAGLPGAQARNAVALALWPTLAVLIALAILVLRGGLPRDQPMDAWVVQLVFVGLAALTLPHMVLLERARRLRPPAQR